jgi:hypothetical protein
MILRSRRSDRPRGWYEVVDGGRSNSREELAALHALEHGVAGAVAQLNPGNATCGIKPPNAVGEELSKSGIARSLLVQRINHDGVVLIAEAVVRE